MAHASLLDVLNAGSRAVAQGLGLLSKEKQYELDQIAYGAGLRLDTEMYKILQDTQNSNNPEEMQAVFQNRIQEWKNTVAYPSGNNSKYYLDKIENIAAQAGATFEKKRYEQALLSGNQRAYALLAANLDNTYAAEDNPDNPNEKLFRGFALVKDAYDHDIINDIEKRKEELTWANRILSNTLQTISDAAQKPEDLRAALDAVSADAYAGYIAGQDIDRAREGAYKQGLNRIKGQNQQTARDMQAAFLSKNEALQRGETAAYTNRLNDLTRQVNAGAIAEEQYRSDLEQLQQTYIDGGFRDTALLRETTALAEAGKAFRDSVGPDGLQDALATASYFDMEDRNMLLQRNRTGSAGSESDFNFEDLAWGVYAQSTQRPGESMGWPFNAAVEAYMSMQEAEGAFKNDDEAGTQRQLDRSRAVYEIGKKLTQYATSDNLAGEGNFFARMLNETKIFMDKKRAAAMLKKSASDVSSLEIQVLQEDLWNQVMNVITEVGTEPERKDALEARIGTIYQTYTDKKFAILRDNAQSESTALSDPNKVAEAMRLITEYPELYNEGNFSKDGYGANINDTARAYMNTAANLLVNALEWPNDGNTFVDVAGNQVIAARDGEKYRVVGEKRNGRETLVVQKETVVDGEKTWQEESEIHIDSRSIGNRAVDFMQYINRGGANPQARQPSWNAMPNTPGNRFGWQGVQGVR
jgi:hypothetical protein